MRVSYTTAKSSFPVYAFFKCPHCGNYNVFIHHITAETVTSYGFIPTFFGNAAKNNLKNMSKTLSDAKNGKYKNMRFQTDCATCYKVPAWAKYGGKFYSFLAFVSLLAMTLAILLIIGLFVGASYRSDIKDILMPIGVLLGIGIFSGIGALLLNKSVDKMVAALEKCNLPTICLSQEELIEELKKVATEEEIMEIKRFNYVAVKENAKK